MGRKIVEILILFGILFSFRAPVIGFSSILMFICLVLLFIFNAKNSYSNFLSLVRNKDFVKIIGVLLGLIIVTFLVTVFHNAYDFTMLPTLINQFINLSLVILYISIFYRSEHPYFYYIEVVCYCFALQGGIMMLSLISNSFKLVVELSQDPKIIDRSLASYGGYRNLAFGVTQFYGLNASMGVAFILNAFLFSIRKRKIYFITLFLIGMGVFFSGRTSLLGVVLGFFFILMNTKFSINKDYKLFGFLFSFLVIFILGFNYFTSLIPESVLNWGLEFYYNYQNGDGLGSRSSDKLFEDMYFMPDSHMFLFGSGRYTDYNGSYFMRTDAGFMRTVLYFGFLGVIMFFSYHLMVLRKISKYLGPYIDKRTNLSLMFFLLMFSIVLNVKGEFFGFLIMSQNLLFAVLFSLIIKYKYINGKG